MSATPCNVCSNLVLRVQDGPGVAAIDLQAVYARLAAAPLPSALRFLAVYTDGGTDGGAEELHYWADHAFCPNHWSPYCSDGPVDISIVGLLKVRSVAEQVPLHATWLLSLSLQQVCEADQAAVTCNHPSLSF